MLLTLGPVSAGVVGWFVGERLGVRGYIGAVVILAGIVLVELGTRSGRDRQDIVVDPSFDATGAP